MLIEFVGCSGAGKTTHIERALRVLSDRGRAAACSTALVARATRTAWISNLLLRNICLNVVLFPWLLLALRRHARFFFFGIRHIVCRADSALGILQRSLSQARNLAANELLRRLDSAPEFILVDEGTICGVHNVLVHLKRLPESDWIETYSRLVPKPDLVIHLDTPVGLALTRTQNRPDPPLRFHILSDRLRFVQFGHDTHEVLSKCEAFRNSWYTVHPGDASSPLGDQTPEDIVSLILSKEAENNGHGYCRES